jgi:protein HIRA/HIR1
VEGWKALKRLPGHESGLCASVNPAPYFLAYILYLDVTDLAFSPGDRYLASAGLDSQVLIWNGSNLELLRKLDQHHGFVKGVCWDPVGQYLATQVSTGGFLPNIDPHSAAQSDDKSVKIWNTTDWSLETSITAPFEKSPGSTFFRRLRFAIYGRTLRL